MEKRIYKWLSMQHLKDFLPRTNRGIFKFLYTVLFFLLSLIILVAFNNFHQYALGVQAATLATYPPTSGTQHYLYVFPDGNMYVYDMDNGFSLVYQAALPGTSAGIRGSVASPTDGMLYVSYGGDGGTGSAGSLLKYNLLTNSIVWQKTYTYGIDSMAITPDGKTIYMPDGAASGDGIWNIIETTNGTITGSITGGQSPHNTVVSLNGSHAYLGGLNNNNLRQADTTTNTVSKTIGPLKAGVRPFTINGAESLAFTNATNFLGFQVSDINSQKVLYTIAPNGFTGSTSHGVSLSPDEKEVYVMDATNSYVHVFNVSGLPATPPATQSASIALTPITGQETPCAYDCHKEGWVLHSRNGKYVFVGDSGDIIDTTTRTLLPRDTSSPTTIFNTLANTRKYIEIDWQNGVPVFTTSRHGLGYVAIPPPPTPTPTPSVSVTPTPTPLPGAVVAQDTFQRANQSLWGTASDGQTWAGDANTASAFSINSNTGQVKNGGSTSYNAILGPSVTDAEVLFSGSMSAYASSNIGSVVRWQDTNNWYKAYIDGTNLVLQKKVNGSNTTLKTVPFAPTAGTNYSLRFQTVGSTLNAKVWQTGQAEPTNWMVTATDTTFTSGRTGLRMLTGSGTASYISFTVTNLSSGTPTSTPTPTPTQTPTPTPTPTPLLSPTPTPTPTPTPVLGTVISQDTFQRPNQTQWGLASDGVHTWGADAATNPIFTITNNTGQVKNGSTSYSAILGATATNAQVLFSGSISSFTNANIGSVLHWSDGNNWYKSYIDGTHLIIQKKVSGTTTVLASVPFAATAGASYSLRFQINGSTLSAKVWTTSGSEPANWMATASDTTFTSGYCGLRMLVPSNTTANYTSFVATSL